MAEGEVTLSWTTATEINNDYFTLERSNDGRTFEAITKINGKGNTTQTSTYYHVDKFPVRGLNYYRLKQTDFDGQYSYSDIKTVEFNGNENVKVYPTIVAEILTVETGGQDGTTVIIRDLAGKTYKTIPVSSKSDKMEFSLNDLIPGIYFVVVSTDNTTFAQKIIKVK